MKTALLLLMIATGYAGYAQVDSKTSQEPKRINVGPPPRVAPGAYSLSPDNMPCVVPDMSTVKPMPNGSKPTDEVTFMPNGYRSTPITLVQQKKSPRKKSDK
jgi:hypothetical protein